MYKNISSWSPIDVFISSNGGIYYRKSRYMMQPIFLLKNNRCRSKMKTAVTVNVKSKQGSKTAMKASSTLRRQQVKGCTEWKTTLSHLLDTNDRLESWWGGWWTVCSEGYAGEVKPHELQPSLVIIYSNMRGGWDSAEIWSFVLLSSP